MHISVNQNLDTECDPASSEMVQNKMFAKCKKVEKQNRRATKIILTDRQSVTIIFCTMSDLASAQNKKIKKKIEMWG